MKKITLLAIFLLPYLGFSQDENRTIQTYLDSNYTKLGLTNQDINDWFVESKANSSATKINNYYIKQRYNKIEIFGAVTNFSLKDGNVINVGNRFVDNTSKKINTTTPSLSVLGALKKAFTLLNLKDTSPEIIETISDKNFKISNGNLTEDAITAELVYQKTKDNKLRLAWDFIIATPTHDHLWSVRIDAVTGVLLEKNDMVISCNFEKTGNFSDNNIEFLQNFLKPNAITAQVQSGSYNVIPYNYESPNHIARQIITAPENALASPNGWHSSKNIDGSAPSGTGDYTITRGNNVYARGDLYGNNTGNSTEGGSALNFDFPYPGPTALPYSYLKAAMTNLFYMNNILHDVLYQYGFNEVNGNFQHNNFGKGGFVSLSGDAVNADAQDYGPDQYNPFAPAYNNANFQTPIDGSKPRMQMYLWNTNIPQPRYIKVNSPASAAGFKYCRDNTFKEQGHVLLPIAPAPGITSDLVLFDDGTAAPSEACSDAINAAALSGHIAVIRASTGDETDANPCSFARKVLRAQDAGAIAVIIVNNITAEQYGMPSSDSAQTGIAIPALSMSKTSGESLIAKMALGPVNATLQIPANTKIAYDGDFDNCVISHEYGHGLSTRLTGGASSSGCLQNQEQMGEGWSDWLGLMLELKPGDTETTRKTIGTFVSNQSIAGSGIRFYPYTTDMTVNPQTFTNTNDYMYFNGTATVGEVHAIGSVWTAMLWDLTWAYINKYGYDDNKYTGTGGNNKVMQLIIDAMKLQPCSPGFVDGRNAIIAADQATTGGQNYCLIWQVFARRGLGVNASSGDTDVANDQVENFDVPPAGPNCTLGVNYIDNQELINVYPNPTSGIVNIRVNNFSGKLNIQVVDINGRVVFNENDTNFNIEKSINLNSLQTGMYIVKLSSDTLSYTQKIIMK